MPIAVILCCNDPNNGNYLGYVEAIEIKEITLEGPKTMIGFKSAKLSRANQHEGDNTLRIGRLQIPALEYKTWVGNWCWDMAKVRGIHALRILNHMAQKRNWQCTDAPTPVYEAFNDRRRVTADEWKAAFT